MPHALAHECWSHVQMLGGGGGWGWLVTCPDAAGGGGGQEVPGGPGAGHQCRAGGR